MLLEGRHQSGSSALSRLPHIRSDASHRTINPSVTAESYTHGRPRRACGLAAVPFRTRTACLCSASTTLAGRVASFENATGLPQKDRTRVVTGKGPSFRTERRPQRVGASVLASSTRGSRDERARSRRQGLPAPRSGGGAKRRALTPVSTRACCWPDDAWGDHSILRSTGVPFRSVHRAQQQL